MKARREATAVVEALRRVGHTAYFAGGCVRDELLGLHPTDYDVATDAVPDQVRRVFRRTHEVGAAFGVMLVPMHGATIEVATFRSEGTYTDKRRPDSVAFTDARNDASRRDFTINALFLDPLEQGPALPGLPRVEGTVIDFVGGVEDLRSKLIRAVGDPEQRLAEDHLRALRAVRFAARLGFGIDPGTAGAITRHARELSGVSRERIGEELRRMLAHPARGAAAGLLGTLGLDAPVLDEGTKAVEAPICGGLEREAPFATALAAWGLDRQGGGTGKPIGAKDREAIVLRWRKSLCLSNHDRDALTGILTAYELLVEGWPEVGVAQRKRAAGRDDFRQGLKVLAAAMPERGAVIAGELTGIGVDLTRPPPKPWVDGGDLIGIGLVPSPAFKRILNAVYDAQLDGTVSSKGQAMELAKKLGV